jgi:hypothetical protein
MPSPAVRPILLVLLLALACGPREQPTASELRTAIEQYRKSDDGDADETRIDVLFARLDAQIAQLRAEAAAADGDTREEFTRRADTLEAERTELQQAWTDARVARAGAAAEDAIQAVGDAVGRSLESAGKKLRDAARR